MALSPLGGGGQADLFVGYRSDNRQKVVVKFLREYRDPGARRMFAREVRILRKRVQGVVPILAAHLEATPPYYVMPYFERGKLTSLAGLLRGDQIALVARELAASISGLHRQCVIHGDIKPDNVLVDGNGALRLGDPMGNGAGCTLAFTANHGGTPGYWAPEVAAGKPISRAGDVFSYGATLFHMVTGTRPRDQGCRDIGYFRAGCSPALRELILACCEQSPAKRPMIHEVQRVLNGESLSRLFEKRRESERSFQRLLALWSALTAIGAAAAARNGRGTA